MEIDQILAHIYPLPEKSRTALKASITQVQYPKGHVLVKAAKIESSIYFISKGIVRAYAPAARTDITFWFGKEGDTILSMKSYVAGQKGYESIELLEDSQLYQLHTPHLQKLFLEDIDLANWGRKLAELELMKLEERLIASQFKTALERYQALLAEQPDVVQRVPLGYIASYLGITQVSLSRIRAELR